MNATAKAVAFTRFSHETLSANVRLDFAEAHWKASHSSEEVRVQSYAAT